MLKIKIFGAGSIGNHIAHAAHTKGWNVTLCDIDLKALERTKNEIYPSRYGSFNNEIKLFLNGDAPTGGYDVIVIGTPPDSHISVALKAIEEMPKAILIEKPFCTPDLNGADELYDKAKLAGIKVFVGYDHVVAPSTKKFLSLAQNIKNIESFDVFFREHWQGIFNAHSWLDGPKDSYLGYWRRGGGALAEHSHALNLWQYISVNIGFGRVHKVNATLKYIKDDTIDYDMLAMLHLTTEKGLIGSVVQDVITKPAQKGMCLQGKTKSVLWKCNSSDSDIVYEIDETKKETVFKKTRPDDFIAELNHVEDILYSNNISPISIENGLDTMLVIAAAHKSASTGKVVTINYNAGYNQNALV